MERALPILNKQSMLKNCLHGNIVSGYILQLNCADP